MATGPVFGSRVLAVTVSSIYVAFVLATYGELLIGWQLIGGWIYSYQTLVGGMLAIAGAGLGGWLLHRQTNQAERHEVARRYQRREAIRSVLPLALSSIVRYATECGSASKALLEQCQNNALPPLPQLVVPATPAIPMSAVAELKELIEYSTGPEIRLVSQIPRVIQYQSSRLARTLEDLRSPPGHIQVTTRYDLEQHVLDAAEVYARTESLFEWARRELEEMPAGTTWDRVRAAVFLMRFWGGEYESIGAIIQHRSGGDLQRFLDDA